MPGEISLHILLAPGLHFHILGKVHDDSSIKHQQQQCQLIILSRSVIGQQLKYGELMKQVGTGARKSSNIFHCSDGRGFNAPSIQQQQHPVLPAYIRLLISPVKASTTSRKSKLAGHECPIKSMGRCTCHDPNACTGSLKCSLQRLGTFRNLQVNTSKYQLCYHVKLISSFRRSLGRISMKLSRLV